jgi:hypothetical protein
MAVLTVLAGKLQSTHAATDAWPSIMPMASSPASSTARDVAQ